MKFGEDLGKNQWKNHSAAFRINFLTKTKKMHEINKLHVVKPVGEFGLHLFHFQWGNTSKQQKVVTTKDDWVLMSFSEELINSEAWLLEKNDCWVNFKGV